MRALVLAALAFAVASPAVAALPPEYYDEARETAAHVVLFEITSVKGLPAGKGYGQCQVTGKVKTVERGRHYRAGGPIQVSVPCMKPNASIPAGGTLWQSQAALKPGKSARAWMNQPGALALYQFEIL